MRIRQLRQLNAQLFNFLAERLDAIHRRQRAAARWPELIAVEVLGQGLFLHGFNQGGKLGTSLQPFRDAQGGEWAEAFGRSES